MKRFFTDPAVIKPERPAAKPLTYRELYPEMFPAPIAEPVSRDIVQSPFVKRALANELPASERSPFRPTIADNFCGGCGNCRACCA